MSTLRTHCIAVHPHTQGDSDVISHKINTKLKLNNNSEYTDSMTQSAPEDLVVVNNPRDRECFAIKLMQGANVSNLNNRPIISNWF